MGRLFFPCNLCRRLARFAEALANAARWKQSWCLKRGRDTQRTRHDPADGEMHREKSFGEVGNGGEVFGEIDMIMI